MNRIDKYFQMAKTVAVKRSDKRKYRLAALGIRSDGAIVTATNLMCRQPEKKAHAEARLARKLDQGAEVYIVRVLKCGAFANARPCMNCQAILWRHGVKRIYYSISNIEYGVMKI